MKQLVCCPYFLGAPNSADKFMAVLVLEGSHVLYGLQLSGFLIESLKAVPENHSLQGHSIAI